MLREKPNATILSLEALILFNNDQTSKWLDEKEPSVHAELLANARKCGLEFKKQYKVRKRKMLEERNEILRAHLHVYKKRKGAADTSHDGIWPMADKGTNCTGNCKVQVKYIQIESIKSPAKFQEKVLEQEYDDRCVLPF